MHRKPAPYTWMIQNRVSSGICTGIPPLIHECTDIIISQVNAPESYPSHMNAPKSSLLRYMHRDPTPHVWMHRNHQSSHKCTTIVPPTHICTLSSLLRKMYQDSTSHTWMHWNRLPSSKCTGILPLTHKCTEIVTQVNKRKSQPWHMNERNHHCSGKCTKILPLTHKCTEIVTPDVNAPKSYPSHMNAPKSWLHR